VTRSYESIDHYVDDVRIPHRPMTQEEMYQILTKIEAQVEQFYMQENNLLFCAKEDAEAALEAVRHDQANNPEIEELHDRLDELLRRNTETPEERATVRKELRPISERTQHWRTELRDAEKAVKDADKAFSRLKFEMEDANLFLSFLAGQRSGLRIGVKIATLLALNPQTQIGTIAGEKAALTLAAAMVDDGQADALVAATLGIAPSTSGDPAKGGAVR